MIHAVAPGLCSVALSKVSRENLPPIPIHYQIAVINALQIQYKYKYKYKNYTNQDTILYAQIQNSKFVQVVICTICLLQLFATSVADRHIQPSGEQEEFMFDIVPYFLYKHKYKYKY